MTSEDRRRTIEVWLRRADEALADAGLLLDHQSVASAMNRCYYAMFYAGWALAIRDGLELHKHRAVISHFHREYVKSGRLSGELGRAFLEAFDYRLQADYHVMTHFGLTEVSALLEQARRFVAEVRALLEAD